VYDKRPILGKNNEEDVYISQTECHRDRPSAIKV
jgi:hypothetical protein